MLGESEAYRDGAERSPIRKAVANDQAELLMKMVAKEMASALLRSGGMAEDEPRDASEERVASNVDVDALLDMVLIAVDRASPSSSENAHRQFRRILRDGIEKDETSETAMETLVGSSCAHSSRATSSRATSSRTTSSRSGSTQSGLSKLSEAKVNGDEPMDIWHPNFWAADLENLEPHSESATHPTHSTRGTENSAKRDARRSQTLDEFLNGCDEISSHSEDEEASAMSEISGLTGVFSDYPVDSRKEPETKRKVPCPDATPTTKQTGAPGAAPPRTAPPGGRKAILIAYSVRFQEVVIREYDRILSDNPACTNGPGIGIGWDFIDMGVRNIDEWEMERRRFRKQGDLMLGRKQREDILYSLGYKEKDMAAAVRAINKVKAQRRQTVNNLSVQTMEEAVESAKTKMKRMLFRKA